MDRDAIRIASDGKSVNHKPNDIMVSQKVDMKYRAKKKKNSRDQTLSAKHTTNAKTLTLINKTSFSLFFTLLCSWKEGLRNAIHLGKRSKMWTQMLTFLVIFWQRSLPCAHSRHKLHSLLPPREIINKNSCFDCDIRKSIDMCIMKSEGSDVLGNLSNQHALEAVRCCKWLSLVLNIRLQLWHGPSQLN